MLEIFIRTDKIFKYFINLGKQKWRLVGQFEFDPDETSQDSWADYNKYMCKVSEKNIHIHWCWRYACVNYRKHIFIGVGDIHPDGQNFQIFCQFEQTKMVISQRI